MGPCTCRMEPCTWRMEHVARGLTWLDSKTHKWFSLQYNIRCLRVRKLCSTAANRKRLVRVAPRRHGSLRTLWFFLMLQRRLRCESCLSPSVRPRSRSLTSIFPPWLFLMPRVSARVRAGSQDALTACILWFPPCNSNNYNSRNIIRLSTGQRGVSLTVTNVRAVPTNCVPLPQGSTVRANELLMATALMPFKRK